MQCKVHHLHNAYKVRILPMKRTREHLRDINHRQQPVLVLRTPERSWKPAVSSVALLLECCLDTVCCCLQRLTDVSAWPAENVPLESKSPSRIKAVFEQSTRQS